MGSPWSAAPWAWGLWSLTLQGPGGCSHSLWLSIHCCSQLSLSLHPGPSGNRGSMWPGFVVFHTPRTWGLLVLTHSRSQFTGLSTLSLFTLAPLELGAPWARGLWSLWIQDIPRTWGCRFPPTLSHSVAQGGRASIQMVVLMTESGPTPHYSRGMGYHAFRGPRPVAWGQRSFSDADWECSNLNFISYLIIIIIIITSNRSFPSVSCTLQTCKE